MPKYRLRMHQAWLTIVVSWHRLSLALVSTQNTSLARAQRAGTRTDDKGLLSLSVCAPPPPVPMTGVDLVLWRRRRGPVRVVCVSSCAVLIYYDVDWLIQRGTYGLCTYYR